MAKGQKPLYFAWVAFLNEMIILNLQCCWNVKTWWAEVNRCGDALWIIALLSKMSLIKSRMLFSDWFLHIFNLCMFTNQSVGSFSQSSSRICHHFVGHHYPVLSPQQAFSVFFVCVAFTSDIICLLFIPVQWLFFAASTYVWVQYVWHTGKDFQCPCGF